MRPITSPLLIKWKNRDKFYYADLAILEGRKMGGMTIEPTSLTSWNWPNAEGVTREGPPYDIDGHSCADIVANVSIPYHKKEYRHLILKELSNYFSYLHEFVIENITKRPILETLKNLKKWGWDYRPFVNPQERWIWVVDSISASTKMEAYEMAEDRHAVRDGYADSMAKFIATGSVYNPKKIQAEADLITREEALESLLKKQDYVQVSKDLYVSSTDPTCMMYDETALPFEYKDGWSPDQLAKIISIWYSRFYMRYPRIKASKEKYV